MSCVKVRRHQEADVFDFGEKLKEARIADGRSVQTLSTSAGISIGYWYQLEREDRGWISIEILESIEKVLGVSFGVKFD